MRVRTNMVAFIVIEKCFVKFYVFSFPTGVYVGTLNLIALIPGLSILTFCWVNQNPKCV